MGGKEEIKKGREEKDGKGRNYITRRRDERRERKDGKR